MCFSSLKRLIPTCSGIRKKGHFILTLFFIIGLITLMEVRNAPRLDNEVKTFQGQPETHHMETGDFLKAARDLGVQSKGLRHNIHPTTSNPETSMKQPNLQKGPFNFPLKAIPTKTFDATNAPFVLSTKRQPLNTSKIQDKVTNEVKNKTLKNVFGIMLSKDTQKRPSKVLLSTDTHETAETFFIANTRHGVPLDFDNSTLRINLSKYFRVENAPFTDYSLNVSLSQTLAIDRKFPEMRPKKCMGKKYEASERKVSVIIPFYNEMWAVLLRTIHSILNRSPPSLIHEIILVDDNSNFENLLLPLESYLKNFPKVKIVRLPNREGLIRARMAGAHRATGNTLAFVDAHVEVNIGWLEPLIELVDKDPSTIAVPVINSIDPLTFEYIYAPIKSQGTFSWNLDFVWKDENASYDEIGVEPHPSATMIGCAFVVDKNFFFKIGYFDEGMNIWGGEQIEISFRTWMCGGSLKVVPCSLVGHIYRTHLPYSFTEPQLYRNLQRIAEVWMDDYKRYYYYTIRQEPFTFTESELEGINKRKKLREKLNCKPFSWYLENLVPHIKPPPLGAVYFGNIKNVGSQMCLQKQNINQFPFKEMRFNYCSLQTTSLTFSFTDMGTIVHKGMCLRYRDELDSAVVLAPCDLNDNHQIWIFQPGVPYPYQQMILGDDVKHAQGSVKLKYGNYTLCLSQILHNNIDIAGALPCAAMNHHQFWIFTYTVNTQRSLDLVYHTKGTS